MEYRSALGIRSDTYQNPLYAAMTDSTRALNHTIVVHVCISWGGDHGFQPHYQKFLANCLPFILETSEEFTSNSASYTVPYSVLLGISTAQPFYDVMTVLFARRRYLLKDVLGILSLSPCTYYVEQVL